MRSLIHQRCFHHAGREAAARCPECGRFYCRECVVEHEQRVICAACLRRIARVPLTRQTGLIAVIRAVQVAAGLGCLCVFFYLLGVLLISLPSSFHEGTLWQGNWLQEP
jgi:hypothetical protein